MPDPYWEKIGKEIKAKKTGSAICLNCREPFTPDRSEMHCLSCRESNRRSTSWRGKGSFGTRPVGFTRTHEQINEEDFSQ